jgi:hypothetical protein
MRLLLKKSLGLCALSVLMILAAGVGYAQNIVKLTVVPDAGASGDPSIYHFTPDEGANSQGISHVFTLKNENSKPVTIVRIDASCSCTTAVVQSGGATPGTSTGVTALAPGAEAKIKVTVSFGDAAAGDLDKTVWVRVENQADPAATMHITGTIVPAVAFEPSTMDFGTVPAGQEKVLIFAVGISPRVPSSGDNPLPTSSVPYLKIAPFTGPMPDPNFPKSYRVLAYQATLPAGAPMGPFEGTIGFGDSRSDVVATMPAPGGGTALVLGGPTGPATMPVAPSAMLSASVPVRGIVTGDLLATPQTAVFGTVSAGHSSSLRLAIASKAGRDLSQMTFTTDQPWLTAHMMGRSGEDGAWSVQIDISGSAPAGAQTATVIGTVGGEKIAISMLAYIVASG